MAQASQQGSMAPFQGQRPLHPGTRIQVGKHVVTVQRFLSQGGFARVYLVRSDQPVELPNGEPTTVLVLKHMCVWNRDALRSVRAEVENHRKLLGHTSIVHFVEASAANLEGNGWEIFILMEYCSGGGLIDFLNTRLHARLHPKEVLEIFRDICSGVSIMHEKQLVHRDLKIENILMSQGDALKFKLCDFGSCFSSYDARPALLPDEKRKMEAELNMHTTIWYRAPEMVNLNLEKKIDQRADVWALGVLLYKLCYYTTPFEGPQGGPSAILSARYTFPPSPPYPSEIKSLIAIMLNPNPEKRPTVDELLTRIEELLKLDPFHKKSQTQLGVEVPLSSPVLRPASATTRPVSNETAARSSPVSQMPVSHSIHTELINTHNDPTLKDTELLKGVSERFPSLEELDSRANVRQLAANYDMKSTTKPKADKLSKPQRGLNSLPDADFTGKQSVPDLPSSPIKRHARSQFSHTTLEIDSSEDSDQEEGPEDPEAYAPFRIHKRDSIMINMEPKTTEQTGAYATGCQVDSARHYHNPKPAQLSNNSKTHEQHAESDSLDADKQKELAELAEQEKALEALLNPTISSNGQEYDQEPLVEDLLGIEGISIRDRASIWEKGPKLISRNQLDEARVIKTSKSHEASRSSISEPLKSNGRPHDSMLIDIYEPDSISKSSEISDALGQNDGSGLHEKPESETVASPKSFDIPTRVQSPAQTHNENSSTTKKTNKLPTPSRLRPQKAKPIKVAPHRESSPTREMQSTSPPVGSIPTRSATWDISRKSQMERKMPTESSPSKKKYVDASTSPVLAAQTGVDSPHGTGIEVLKNAPGVRERMNQLQTLSTRQDSNDLRSTISLPENESQLQASSDPGQDQVQKESPSPDQQYTKKMSHPETKREESQTNISDLEPNHTNSRAKTQVSASSTNVSSRPSISQSKVGTPATTSEIKEDVAMMLSQRAGQVRLTKRVVQEDTPEKPWEKEAQVARRLQGLKDVSRESDREEASSPEDPPFAGVNALISRWQSQNP